MSSVYKTSFLEKLKNANDTIVLTLGDRVVYADDVLHKSLQLAQALREMGCKNGDIAVIAAATDTDLLTVVYGTMAAGMRLAMIDPEMGRDNYREKLGQLQAKIAFVDGRLLLLQEHPIAYWLARRFKNVPFIPTYRGLKIVTMGSWLPILRPHKRLSKLLKDNALNINFHNLPNRDDEFLITYTSGTVAAPKGVVHTLAGLKESIGHLQNLLGDPTAQRIATHLPHYALLGISAGIPVFTWDYAASAAEKLAFIRRHNITTLFGPPADFVPILQYLEQHNEKAPNCLRLILLGSAPVYPAFLHRLLAFLPEHVAVKCLYGMTENLVVASVSAAEKLAYSGEGDVVGYPVEGVACDFADDHEFLLHSPQSYTRYWHETARKEWHETGDLAKITEGGLLTLLGRKKDMIIRRNFNLYPALYESTVAKIEGVEACAFVGVYDEKLGDEIVYLVVELDKNKVENVALFQKNLLKMLKSGGFSIDKEALPDKIIFQTLPRSGRNRKVDKKELRKQIMDNLSKASQ